MKKTLLIAAALFVTVNSWAQIPAGFVQGSITMADGSTKNGYVKDNTKKNASLAFVDNSGSNKQQFDGSQINGAVIDGTSYTCIKGDFFKMICNGKICFLQKASNASGKTIYNGSEAIILPGTDGKIGDYFTYSNNQLTHITQKTLDAIIAEQFASCNAAIEKARSINGNLAALADAVAIYNAANK
ncbi:MAG: hypothetical protein QM791_04630 [Ferruginibacter sp.]